MALILQGHIDLIHRIFGKTDVPLNDLTHDPSRQELTGIPGYTFSRWIRDGKLAEMRTVLKPNELQRSPFQGFRRNPPLSRDALPSQLELRTPETSDASGY